MAKEHGAFYNFLMVIASMVGYFNLKSALKDKERIRELEQENKKLKEEKKDGQE